MDLSRSSWMVPRVPNKTRRNRLYWRNQGDVKRAYGDFRNFSDVGRKREALIPPGSFRGTTDPGITHKLLADRLSELEERRMHRILLDVPRQGRLAEFARYRLIQKAKNRRVTTEWVAQSQCQVEEAVAFFGPARELGSIRTKDGLCVCRYHRQSRSAAGTSLCP